MIIEVIQYQICQGRYSTTSSYKKVWFTKQFISCKAKNPLTKTSADYRASTFQNYRLEYKLLNEKINETQQNISSSSIDVSTKLRDIISGTLKYSWHLHQSYLKTSSTDIYHHRMVICIRYCLLLAANLLLVHD